MGTLSVLSDLDPRTIRMYLHEVVPIICTLTCETRQTRCSTEDDIQKLEAMEMWI